VLRVYDSTTRGNMFKLDKDRAKYDLRKFYFTNRVVNAGWYKTRKCESAKARKSIGIKCESARESTFAFYTPSLQ